MLPHCTHFLSGLSLVPSLNLFDFLPCCHLVSASAPIPPPFRLPSTPRASNPPASILNPTTLQAQTLNILYIKISLSVCVSVLGRFRVHWTNQRQVGYEAQSQGKSRLRSMSAALLAARATLPNAALLYAGRPVSPLHQEVLCANAKS